MRGEESRILVVGCCLPTKNISNPIFLFQLPWLLHFQSFVSLFRSHALDYDWRKKIITKTPNQRKKIHQHMYRIFVIFCTYTDKILGYKIYTQNHLKTPQRYVHVQHADSWSSAHNRGSRPFNNERSAFIIKGSVFFCNEKGFSSTTKRQATEHLFSNPK